jgi:hypothetical protein
LQHQGLDDVEREACPCGYSYAVLSVASFEPVYAEGGELVVAVLAGRKSSVEAGLAADEAGGERRELVIEIVGVDGGDGRRAVRRAWRWCWRAADRRRAGAETEPDAGMVVDKH